MTIEETIKEINIARKAAGKGQWWTYYSPKKEVQVKGFDTWIQVLAVPAWRTSGVADISVKEFNLFLTDRLSRAFPSGEVH